MTIFNKHNIDRKRDHYVKSIRTMNILSYVKLITYNIVPFFGFGFPTYHPNIESWKPLQTASSYFLASSLKKLQAASSYLLASRLKPLQTA